MRIGLIGGLDRNVAALQAMGEASGHEVRFHTGVMAGPASAAALRALVARCDLVVVVTDINSHNAVRTARREARQLARPLKIVRKMGHTQFAALLHGLADGHHAAAA
jgi:4-hydroxy-3-methylbut-2-enyl diphosphate reductase IspH